MAQRLYRSETNKMLCGVCGGIGEYFDIDPVVIRIIAVLLLVSGIGMIAYIVGWIIIPVRPEGVAAEPVRKDSEFRKYLPGVFLIALGIVFLTEKMFWWFHFEYIWPLGLVAVGLYLIFRSVNGKKKEEEIDESIQS